MSRVKPELLDPRDESGATVPDGNYSLGVEDGLVIGLVEGGSVETTALVPWTTTLSSGDPSLMWDEDDNLMMVEVPR